MAIALGRAPLKQEPWGIFAHRKWRTARRRPIPTRMRLAIWALVDITLYQPKESERGAIRLPPAGLFPISIGGVEGLPMFRFEFWARMQADDIPGIGDTP